MPESQLPEGHGQIIVIDDNPSVRSGLDSLFRSIGYEVTSHASADAFAKSPLPRGPACIVLDVRMPGRSGLALFAELSQDADSPPVVFLTGHGDVPMAARAFKAGAVDFLLKPFQEQELLDAVATGLRRDRERKEQKAAAAELLKRAAGLSHREREVISGIAATKTNRQIALDLGLSEVMIKVHRGSLMRKLGARNFAELLRTIDQLERVASRDVRPLRARHDDVPPWRARAR